MAKVEGGGFGMCIPSEMTRRGVGSVEREVNSRHGGGYVVKWGEYAILRLTFNIGGW